MKFLKIAAPTRIPKPVRLADVYFHRDILTKSFDGNNVDILTISSFDELSSGYELIPNHTFPNQHQRSRLFTMKTKKFFIVTARVHPGETISSFMLDGFLDFILSSDPRAVALRKLYVFKIIPMLNPDGVIRGNYRGDHLGMNLNRVYQSPDPVLHPTIYATKTYTNYIMTLGSIDFYIDFHGHANKSGSFLFGNWIDDVQKQKEMLLFAKYCMKHNALFSFDECDFGPNSPSTFHELEKATQGTSRVAMHKLTSATRVFTFEANYYGYKVENRTKRFSMQDMKGMGISIALAAFDATVLKSDGDKEVKEWVEDNLVRLYQEAGIPLPGELSKL